MSGLTAEQLLQNRSLGASALLAHFLDLLPSLTDAQTSDLIQNLKRSFPLMAVWPFVQAYFDREGTGAAAGLKLGMIIAEDRRKTMDRALQQLTAYRCFATLSRSSLVEAVLLELAARKKLLVFCSRSLPAEEGLQLHQQLIQAGVHCRCLSDWDLADHLAQVEALLLGADWVTEAHFINKWGSGALTRTALAQGIPVFVIAETYKRILADAWNPADLYQDWSQPDGKRQIQVVEVVRFQAGIQLL